MHTYRPSPDFKTAASNVFSILRERVGFDTWVVAQRAGDAWVAVQVDGGGIEEGAVVPWMDSFCRQMVEGHGPRVAPRVGSVPAYAGSPFATRFEAAAYIGVPLLLSDGSFFGTLCAIDAGPRPETVELDLVEALAKLLGGLLHAGAEEPAVATETEKYTDELTGVYNRRGWRRLLTAEESRCRRHGNPASVVVINLNDFGTFCKENGDECGDALLVLAARAIRTCVRQEDVVARLVDDTFAVLGVECDAQAANGLVKRLRGALDVAGVAATMGVASRVPTTELDTVWQQAEEALEENKRIRKEAAGAR